MSAVSTSKRTKPRGRYRTKAGGKFKGVVLDTLERVNEDFAEAAGLLRAGFSEEQVMAWTHLTAEEMKVAKAYRFPAGEMMSPEELEERAAIVRNCWTDEERQLREVCPSLRQWNAPTVQTMNMDVAA